MYAYTNAHIKLIRFYDIDTVCLVTLIFIPSKNKFIQLNRVFTYYNSTTLQRKAIICFFLLKNKIFSKSKEQYPYLFSFNTTNSGFEFRIGHSEPQQKTIGRSHRITSVP